MPAGTSSWGGRKMTDLIDEVRQLMQEGRPLETHRPRRAARLRTLLLKENI